MPITSPRFTTDSDFERVSRNALALKKGKSNHAIQVIQQGLIDLGFPFSPSDGIYGRNTEKAVKKFQEKNRLKVDGVVGPKTLGRLDTLLSKYQFKVKLHFRSINLTNVPFNKIFSSTQEVFKQYGIKVEMGSGKSLFLTKEQMKKFFVVNGSCNWTISSGEIHELHGMGGSVPANEILVYYINKFSESGLLGCGGHAKNRPAVTVASNASRWDTAHEVGHVLLTSSFTPVHHPSLKNLMHATASTYPKTPVLNETQLSKIKAHPCCQTI